MQGSPTISAAGPDAFAEPFRLLGSDPAATLSELDAAYAKALAEAVAPEPVLAAALAAIKDPARRLACELAFPIDSTPAERDNFYAALSGEAATAELLAAAAKLPPLSRANFLAHLAAHRPASSALLAALLQAHVGLEVTEIYAVLNRLRSRAGWSTPSLLSVSSAVSALFAPHAEAAVAGFGTIGDAGPPMAECAERTLASGEPHHLKALEVLLSAYRRASGELRAEAGRKLEDACTALAQHPEDAAAFEALAGALRRWNELSRSLILFDAARGRLDGAVEAAIEQVRQLLAGLSTEAHYTVARRLADLSAEVFGPVPEARAHFDEAAALLQKLSHEADVRPLADLITQHEAAPAALLKALEKTGFGQNSGEPARALWQAFCQAARATEGTDLGEQPWFATRELATSLGVKPQSALAACRLIAGLLGHGESVAADPAILAVLRDDLAQIEHSHSAVLPSKRFGKRTVIATALLCAAIACALIGYRFFQTDILRLLARLSGSPVTLMEGERVPQAGKGQHFSRDYVRYCHFQEERLRVVKQELHGLEDFRAYNVLANDYNSRCSDFFYQDEDLKAVTEELNANRQNLEADAHRILAGWPWHAAAVNPPAAAPPTAPQPVAPPPAK